MSNPIAKIGGAIGLILIGLAFQLCALTVADASSFRGCARTPSPPTDQVALITEERAAEQDVADNEDDDVPAALPDPQSSRPAHRVFQGIAQSNYLRQNPGHTFRDRSPPVSRI